VSESLTTTGTPIMLLVRRGLIALTVVSMLSTAFELAAERHWNGVEQLVPWLALAVLVAATTLHLFFGERGTTITRVLALIVLGASLYGVVDHVLVNFHAGELDQRFADTWDSLPLPVRGWYAVTKTVGPAPTLAPGVLGQAALLLLLATLCNAPPGRRHAA
jgi:hypothetical protein